jgi:uncharacterized membrane protein
MKTTNGRSPPTDPTHSRAHSVPRLYTDALIGEIIEIIFSNYLNKEVMKTTVIESGKNTAVTAKANNGTGTTAKTGNTNGNPQTAGNNKAESEPKKTESPAPVQATEQPKPQAEQPKETKTEAPKAEATKAEPTKLEIKQQLAGTKAVLNLEGTLKTGGRTAPP